MLRTPKNILARTVSWPDDFGHVPNAKQCRGRVMVAAWVNTRSPSSPPVTHPNLPTTNPHPNITPHFASPAVSENRQLVTGWGQDGCLELGDVVFVKPSVPITVSPPQVPGHQFQLCNHSYCCCHQMCHHLIIFFIIRVVLISSSSLQARSVVVIIWEGQSSLWEG